MAILQKQVMDLEAQRAKLEADLATMDKAWRMERLHLKAAEALTRKEKDAVQKELDKALKKRFLGDKGSEIGPWSGGAVAAEPKSN